MWMTPEVDPSEHCSNEPSPWMVKQGKSCEGWKWGIPKECIGSDYWKMKKFCQQSCSDLGAGYEGDDCPRTQPYCMDPEEY